MTDLEPKAETGRDRVRRLFIDPLTSDGMRFKHGTPPDAQRKRLDQMADDLGYLSDAGLAVMRGAVQVKGEGAAKCFWPSRVLILQLAQAFQPRPMAQMPGLRSWFCSAAGPAAAAVPGRLIAEYQFWQRKLHPPFRADTSEGAQHRRMIATDAARIAERQGRLTEREARGALSDPADIAWLDGVRRTEAMIKGWMDQEGTAT